MNPSVSTRFELVAAPEGAARSTLEDDVRRGLTRRPRQVPPKHFYDAAGSALFDEICTLSEYYLTRAEYGLLERHAHDIVDRAGAAELFELGSGMARKTGLLLRALARRVARPSYVPLDISPDALEASARTLLAAHRTLVVRAVVGDFQRDLDRLAHHDRRTGPTLFAFLGSTVGNLDEHEAPALVRSIAACMRHGDSFLLGVDLVKDRRVLHAAYNDARGVTARFNKNVLAVMNRDLDADFDLPSWDHEAFYDEGAARIEMHLRTKRAATVRLEKLDLEVRFEEGERILTEISRKFTRGTVESTLRQGGMVLDAWYTPDDGAFALALARRG